MADAAQSRVRKTRSGSESRKRQHITAIRWDEDEYAQLQEALAIWRQSTAAQRHGDSLGALVRHAVIGDGAKKLRAAPRRTFELPSEKLLARMLGQLLKIGNNVNQIARAMNSGGMSSPEAVQDAAEDVQEACQSIRQAMGLFR